MRRLFSDPTPVDVFLIPASAALIVLGVIGMTAPVHAAQRAAAHKANVTAPPLNPGDSWTYAQSNESRGSNRTTHDMVTVVRADSQLIVVNVRAVNTPGPGREQLVGPEWSRLRSINGHQTVVNRPLAYPLSLGKTWSVDYNEFTPADRSHTRESWQTTYKVAAWEEVTVPAGTFRALRIDADGTWTAELPANTVLAQGRAANGANLAMASRQGARLITGRLLKTFWYVPDVHRWVKSEEDIFDTNGARTSHVTADLEAYALADPQGAEADASPDVHDAPDAAPSTRPKHAAKPHRPATAARVAPPADADDAGSPPTPAPSAKAAPAAPRSPKPVAPAPPPLLQELRWIVPAKTAAS